MPWHASAAQFQELADRRHRCSTPASWQQGPAVGRRAAAGSTNPSSLRHTGMKKFYDKNSCTVIDLHTYGWDEYPCRSDCAATMINSHLPEGGVVVDYGCGRMHLKHSLRDNIVYVPVDIVSRCKGCIICDFTSDEPLPKVHCDIAILNGVMQLGESYDRRLIKHMMQYSDFILSDRRLDHILGADKTAHGYTLTLVTRQGFLHGAHDGRPQDEYLFKATAECRSESAQPSQHPDIDTNADFTSEERPLGPPSFALQPREAVHVGSTWQGIPDDAWAGKIATIARCDLLYKGRGTVDVEYERGGWDSFWLDSFLHSFRLMAGA